MNHNHPNTLGLWSDHATQRRCYPRSRNSIRPEMIENAIKKAIPRMTPTCPPVVMPHMAWFSSLGFVFVKSKVPSWKVTMVSRARTIPRDVCCNWVWSAAESACLAWTPGTGGGSCMTASWLITEYRWLYREVMLSWSNSSKIYKYNCSLLECGTVEEF